MNVSPNGVRAAAVIFAAGRGSRMTGYEGNKTLLPLKAEASSYVGSRPFLHEILDNLPEGSKAVVVNYRKEDVVSATRSYDPAYVEQPVTDGTGGALLAARWFLRQVPEDKVIVTMGDVPLIRRETFRSLLECANRQAFAVLGFKPRDKAQYGVLEMESDRVVRITEWRYWKEYAPERRAQLRVFNAGIYAGDRAAILRFLEDLEARPHLVEKRRGGRTVSVKEYFITDLVELMTSAGVAVGCHICEDETEVMGVDDPDALEMVQREYSRRRLQGN
ncbi:MAG: NTP transferase domain-containing protein [Deltaproteobacteria bacterium]|nr:NTP transferase domain-containing protein [Deltaproteobacteria bacterium]